MKRPTARTRHRAYLKAAPAPAASARPRFGAGRAGGWAWTGRDRIDYARELGDVRGVSVVAIILGWLKRQVPQAEPMVGTRDATRKWEPEPEHELGTLLARPNPWFSARATWAGTLDWLIPTGEAFWLKVRDGVGLLREAYWVPNAQIEVVPSNRPGQPVAAYLYQPPTGAPAEYAPWDVVHFRLHPDPHDPASCRSPLDAQVRNMAALNYGERYTAAVLRNGRAGKVLVPREAVGEIYRDSAEESEQIALARKLERDTTGEQAGGITTTSLPVDLLDAGMGPEEMTLDRILDRPEAYLCAALGLNPMALDLPSSADTRTYANKGEARREAWEQGVIPLQDAIADVLQDQLLYRADENGVVRGEFGDPPGKLVWWDRSEVAALKEDANEKANRAATLYAGSIITLDESRALLDLPPLGPSRGGDKTAGEVGQERAKEIAASSGGEGDGDADPFARADDDADESEAA